jgi:DNA-binding beta-propeller fold protein YncE
LRFIDCNGYGSGYLAFTPPVATTTTAGLSRPLLLVTDAGHDAVHLVDVVGRSHAGYLASPGSIAGPRGVAASGASPLVAVSAWKRDGSGDHVVVVYRGSGAVWEAVRVIGGGLGGPGSGDGQLRMPYGLRFSGDGSTVCVADCGNNGVSLFRVGDGGFVRHIATGLSGPMDVEEVEGGWLVACYGSSTVKFVGDGADAVGGAWPSLGKAGGAPDSGDGEFYGPSALAVVPGLGLVVREDGNSGRLQVFVTPDTIAMVSMSPNRVAWMTVVARGVFRRKGAMLQRGSDVGLGQAGGSKRARTVARGGAL